MPRPTRLSDVQPFTIGDARFYPLSSPSQGGTELAVWQLRLPPGRLPEAGVPHTIDREEVFVCVRGELVITVDGVPARLSAGDALAVPAGSRISADAGADGAVATVCTRAGLTAVMEDGTALSPPWAN